MFKNRVWWLTECQIEQKGLCREALSLLPLQIQSNKKVNVRFRGGVLKHRIQKL